MKTILALGVAALAGIWAVPASAQSINAAGATFPAPIYQKWFSEYQAAHSAVKINYQPIGSGGGIKNLQDGTVDFGASDMPMTDEQLAACKIKPLHFPTVLGAVVITYNIPGVTGALKLTPEVVAGIFLGEIKTWGDAKIKAANPGVNLPDKPIVVVHRSDASGTSFVFTNYLSKVSPTWKSKVGENTSVSWPTGLGQKGNDGVAGMVKQAPNSVGYVELIYAAQNKMTFADLKNAAGKFVTASFDSVTAAAASMKDMPADFRVSITNAPGAASYPISTFTWLLIPSQIPDAAKRTAITGFLKWMIADGQKEAQPLDYAPLPKSVVDKEAKQIALIK
ncbi:MAG: phosphate ABC transporter substrate-binding protein PstS [Bryobacteraceae bacterium]|jgi:phosphate transport system substrate-binding protein